MAATHVAFAAFEALLDEESGSFTDGQVGLMGTTRICIVADEDEARAFGVNADGTGWVATLLVTTVAMVDTATWTITPTQGTSTDVEIAAFLEDMRTYINLP